MSLPFLIQIGANGTGSWGQTGPMASILLAVSNPAAGDNLSVFDPASPPAASIRDLFILVLAVTGAIFVVVEGLLLYCIVRFRSHAHHETAEPPQVYGSKPIEVAWTVAPVLIVFVLFLVVIRTVSEARQDNPPPGALQVTVVGHQWWWEYRYRNPNAGSPDEPDYLFITANEMHVPVQTPVYLQLESADVVHSFWVPRLAGKTDVIPNRINQMWFQANKANTYLGQCAEYCGTQHANMLLRVVAEEPEEYQRWQANQKKQGVNDPKTAAGRQFFLTHSCVNCHAVNGTPARGTFGPDLTHLRSRDTLASGMIPNTPEQMAAWLRNPQSIKDGCLMPDLKLSEKSIQDLVAYFETLR